MYNNAQLVDKFLTLIQTNADIMAHFSRIKFGDNDADCLTYCKIIRNSVDTIREILEENPINNNKGK